MNRFLRDRQKFQQLTKTKAALEVSQASYHKAATESNLKLKEAEGDQITALANTVGYCFAQVHVIQDQIEALNVKIRKVSN